MSTQSTISPNGFVSRFFAGAAFVLGVGLLGSACGPKYPNCEEDGDCKAGEFCVNQLCQKCRSDSDCGAGQQCTGGACSDIPGYCDSSRPCPSGQTCNDNNRCELAETVVPTEQPPVAVGCSLDTVYFAFDSSSLEPAARDAIAKNANCIKEKNYGGVQVTGYTDPRGTEEYNLALGDRRAKSVEQYLGSLGIDKGKLSTSSMGEEMARGEDEAGWAKDRKVEFTSR
jgi:peptidoglycan-associated lipoprotein